ncbi:MAG: GDP-mannose 4,6-dehydratase, partial [Anaerolineae bacterium]|nr:GDP-mannose 4,6-dehydratase [Anaerolineae bacterium]
PWGTLKNNIQGQLNVLQACVTQQLEPRILVIGSSEEYGRVKPVDLPITEVHPLQPENPYSVSKVTQDLMGYQYFSSFKLPVIRLRPFNHIGPGQSPRFVLPAFASQVAQIEAGLSAPIIKVGNLSPARDFTDVRDVVHAYYLALLHGQAGAVYNIASGKAHTIQFLLDQLLSSTQVKIQVTVDPERFRPADTPVIFGSSTLLTQHTGWVPRIKIKQTIQDVLGEWRRTILA